MATRLPLGAGLLEYGENDALAEEGAGDREEAEAALGAPVVAGGRGNAVIIRGGWREPSLLIVTDFSRAAELR